MFFSFLTQFDIKRGKGKVNKPNPEIGHKILPYFLSKGTSEHTLYI